MAYKCMEGFTKCKLTDCKFYDADENECEVNKDEEICEYCGRFTDDKLCCRADREEDAKLQEADRQRDLEGGY